MKLLITSNDNVDWCGSWFQKDVEDTLTELNISIDDHKEWMYYILEKVFGDQKDFTKQIEDIICLDCLQAINLKLKNGNVTIRKE